MGTHSSSLFRLLLSTVAIGAANGCREECHANATWCDGDTLNRCEDTGNKVKNKRSLRSEDCSEEGLVCVPAERPYCGIPDFDCRGRVARVCIGERIASCSEGRTLPALILDCREVNKTCVELDDRAVCSDGVDPCDPSLPPTCEDGNVVSCVEGVSMMGPRCFGACATEGAEQCENELAPVRCTDGLWQVIEDCVSPCACTVDADAAACVCE